ncbi:MAG: 50S ribosomal protein L6 [Actinomycetota bacterium]
MSRIGKSPITVPAGVSVEATPGHVKVTGPQGSLERSVPEGISLTQEGDVLTVSRIDDSREHRSLHGLLRTLIANMVTGVTTGYTKELEIVGVGYRCAAKGPDSLELALGYSHPVFVDAPSGITFEVPVPTRIIVKGIDKEQVGQMAANIRKLRKPEPYKGKGVRYAGEHVLRKAGKAAK